MDLENLNDNINFNINTIINYYKLLYLQYVDVYIFFN